MTSVNPLRDPIFLVIRKKDGEYVAASEAVFEGRDLAEEVASELDAESDPRIVRLEGLIAHVLRAMIAVAKQEVNETHEPTETPQGA